MSLVPLCGYVLVQAGEQDMSLPNTLMSFLSPFGSQMHVTGEDEGLWVCTQPLVEVGNTEACLVQEMLWEKKKKKKMKSTWKRARYINSLTIQVPVSSK